MIINSFNKYNNIITTKQRNIINGRMKSVYSVLSSILFTTTVVERTNK